MNNYNYNNNNDNERSRREWRQAASDLIARESRSAQQSRREPDSHGAEYARQYMREMGMPTGERDASARGDSRNDTRRNTYESRPARGEWFVGKNYEDRSNYPSRSRNLDLDYDSNNRSNNSDSNRSYNNNSNNRNYNSDSSSSNRNYNTGYGSNSDTSSNNRNYNSNSSNNRSYNSDNTNRNYNLNNNRSYNDNQMDSSDRRFEEARLKNLDRLESNPTSAYSRDLDYSSRRDYYNQDLSSDRRNNTSSVRENSRRQRDEFSRFANPELVRRSIAMPVDDMHNMEVDLQGERDAARVAVASGPRTMYRRNNDYDW